MDKTKIAILFGGLSPEHNTSLAGGFSIIIDINIDKYDIFPIYVKQNGDFSTYNESVNSLYDFLNDKKNHIYLDPETSIDKYKEKLALILKDNKLKSESMLENLFNKEFDIVFPIFHGKNGEDGSIQGLLDFLDIAYVGCGITGSAICIDKEITKKICEANNIPVVEYLVYKKYQWEEEKEKLLTTIENKIDYPLFVKPVSLGSSIGITKAKNRDELINGLQVGFDYDSKVLIEKGLKVEEYSVSVIGNDRPIASEIALFRSLNPDFFDFESKYSEKALSSIIPAPIDDILTKEIKTTAINIYKFLELNGFARIDFFIENRVLYLNEVNTIPGLDIYGTFIKQWKKSGIDKTKLIDMLIDFGFEKFNEKQRLKNCY
ncbi:MAG TPA: D-alanine--D-alanine ligase family protein [Spirochaetota bacterium]|nr:D-alanine--D-alanine ligase family protein [Spirochaetota bacterium]